MRKMQTENFITGKDRERIQELLDKDEELLWCGKPDVGPVNAGSVITMIFSLMWTSVAIFMLTMTLNGDEGGDGKTGVAVVLGFFVAIGLGMIIFMPAQIYREIKSRLYAITNRRAIVVMNGQKYEYPLQPYMVLQAHTPEGKRGNIVFEQRIGRNDSVLHIGFLKTPDAPAAMSILHKLLDGKVTKLDKPEDLPRNARRLQHMKKARYLPFFLVLVIGIVLFLADFLIGMSLNDVSTEYWIIIITFSTVSLISIVIMLYSSIIGRRYKKEEEARKP